MPPILNAQGLTKAFGATALFRDISFTVSDGDRIGLIGPNGAGKSTLLKVLAGEEDADGGDVAVRKRARIGYVPEAAPVYGNMRVREFLAFMARLRGLPARQVVGAVDRVIDMLALGAVADRPARVLSRGYRQRAAIAQALVHDPPVVVLDEPTNGLDPRQIIEIRELIRGLAGHHTVIVSSHVLSEVARIADRVAILLDGRLLGVRAIADTPDLEAWFLSVA